MDVIIVFAISFLFLIASITKDIYLAYPLSVIFILFTGIALKRGFKFKEIMGMAWKGGKKSLGALKIFVLIGAIISLWMAAGTVPAIVYYGLNIINPNFFILFAFIITCAVSFLIGTSLGTTGTIGVALIIMARSGGSNVTITAGAILAAAYFGDRCSPMSSSANLVAELTNTKLYDNVRNMFKSSIIPFTISVILYAILSIKYPLVNAESDMPILISEQFLISWVVLIPAIIILILAFFKVDVKKSILISIASAFIISVALQGWDILSTLNYAMFGFELDPSSPIYDVMQGGGIYGMVLTAVVVFIPSAFSGIIEETKMLDNVNQLVLKAQKRSTLFLYTVVLSVVTAGFGCTQVISVIMTHMFMGNAYDEREQSESDMALDLENSSIVIAALIPWNVAALVPLTTMMVGNSAIIFAFYLYLLPLTWYLTLLYKESKQVEGSADLKSINA